MITLDTNQQSTGRCGLLLFLGSSLELSFAHVAITFNMALTFRRSKLFLYQGVTRWHSDTEIGSSRPTKCHVSFTYTSTYSSYTQATMTYDSVICLDVGLSPCQSLSFSHEAWLPLVLLVFLFSCLIPRCVHICRGDMSGCFLKIMT